MLAGRYRLDAAIGWGGLAVVFQATDMQQRSKKTSRPLLAIKIVRADLPPDLRQEAINLFRWEAHLLRRLRHHALPRMESFASDQHTAWIVRELVVGTPLSAWAARAPCDPQQVRGWALQICDLLSYLHTRTPAVICSDLKPANLILRPDGSLSLIDLGSAHTQTQRPPRRPRPRYGTPGYAPPEQLGNWGIDERTDLFSLGVICYELLTGIDPTTAPLQFDLARLAAAAPPLALALRWALALDPPQRVPTAAVLRATLSAPVRPEPLDLGYGIHISSHEELLATSIRHPHLLERALTSGAVENWLAIHPERPAGALLHDLRVARRTAPPQQRALDTFYMALAPAEGSSMLHVTPAAIEFGLIPLRRWAIWSLPRPLLLHNAARHPLRWELECPNLPDAEIRIMIEGRSVRRWQGVLPPGGRVQLELVAAGRAGKCHGALILRCGAYDKRIPWQAVAVAGLPVGNQFATEVDDLDLSQPDLIPTLEELLERNLLSRWLHARGKRKLAAELATAARNPLLTPLQRRLLLMRVLHPLDPQRFPLLQVSGWPPPALHLSAGTTSQHTLVVENRGTHACTIVWASRCPWLHLSAQRSVLQPGEQASCVLTLAPPASLAPGQQQAVLDIQAGNLALALDVPIQISTRPWWQRMIDWLGIGTA